MDKMKELKELSKKIKHILAQLDKNRTSVLEDGWQTQRHAKKSRKWDYYAQEKMKIFDLVDEVGCPASHVCQCKSDCVFFRIC